MKKIFRWYLEVWADVIENFDKNYRRHGGYIERRAKLLIGSAWLRALAVCATFAFLLDFNWVIFNHFIVDMLVIPALLFMLFDYFVVFHKERYAKFQQNRSVKTNGKMFGILFTVLPALISIIIVLKLYFYKHV